jgi:quinol monooxygenase YgiN
MIKVVANNFVKEGCIDQFLAIAKILEEETNRLDAGCISYAMHRNLSDPTIITCIEEWESEEAMNAHLGSEHFKKSAAELGPYCAKPTEVTLYKKCF